QAGPRARKRTADHVAVPPSAPVTAAAASAPEGDEHRAKRQATLREMRSSGVEIVDLLDDEK
ncbi:hypothetical protein VTH06DRAFT_5844, partial [Thermothelomyces fergusii]